MDRNDVFYAAMLARDHRFDGKFFVGVKTTGIYCRPICPAKPKRENVEFFKNDLEAEKAGYRPCLRCRPESAPQSSAWIGTSAVVQRAMRSLQNPKAMEQNEDQFAQSFGVTSRHLRRLFTEEIGKTPKQLLSESRLNLARQLITETALPMTEIAFASGFQSIRRFNGAFKERFKKSPRQIRRQKVKDASTVQLTLSYRPPFDFEGLIKFYASHATGRLEWFEAGKMFRVVESQGKVGKIAISNDEKNSRLIVDIDFPEIAVIATLLAQVRALFDLDSDPVMIANALEVDPKIKALLKKHSGLRLPSGWDAFEVAIGTILGQLVSVERGRALLGELIEELGEDSGFERDGKRIKLFPRPEVIAKADLGFLKTTGLRKKTLQHFSKAVAENKISLSATQDMDEFIEKVTELPGIGEWSAAYMALRALRYTDAFPGTDLILARALKKHSPKVIESLRPWRGYVAILLWREYAHSLKKNRSQK